MDRSDLQETLVALYLRLNGYFTVGFIVHAPDGNLTELDVLAVRFPEHKEPEREIQPCTHLHPPKDRIDFLIGEVKGGEKNLNFNAKFRECPEAVKKVLNRIGAFSDKDIEYFVPQIIAMAKPETLRKADDFPVLPVGSPLAQIRLVLFAPDQKRDPKNKRPVIYGDDVLDYSWKCLHPLAQRVACAVDYDRKLWGHQFNDLVAYFKDRQRHTPGTIKDVYLSVLGDTLPSH